jgi:hypothetical protein
MKARCHALKLAPLLTLSLGCAAQSPSTTTTLAFESREGAVVLLHGTERIAEYVYRDPAVTRPYLSRLRAPGGVQVTRNQPPLTGQDDTDHPTFHPGVWLAFADVSGQDSWRNLAAIRHERFTAEPSVRDGRITFATESRMLTTNGQPLCTLVSQFIVCVRPAGYLLIWDAVFHADQQDIVFGDQEEMGLGVRVATPIAEKHGGRITSSSGLQTAKATWGKAHDWCDYSGIIGSQRVGITLMTDPANFRPSWFHNRNYGLMVANPFGRKSMKQGEESRVVVKRGDRLSLRFGILLHTTPADKELDLAAAYRDFLAQLVPTPP